MFTVLIILFSFLFIGSLGMMASVHFGLYIPSFYNDIDEKEFDNEIESEINDYRESKNLERLEYSSTLSDGATDKSIDMVEEGYFNHTSPSGETVRYDSCGVTTENIAKIPHKKITRSQNGLFEITTNAEDFADKYITEIVNSKDHRENIESEWDTHGVGVDIDSRNNVYVTHHMCKI